jgi:hypothetical protein
VTANADDLSLFDRNIHGKRNCEEGVLKYTKIL